MAASGADTTAANFGSCCETLRNVLTSQEFEPLISVGDDGILYTTIGIIDTGEDEAGMVEYPLLFCPFCGTRLQADDVASASHD